MSNDAQIYSIASLPSINNISIKHLPIKRTFDILFSLSVLVLFLPVFLTIMLFVIFTSKGKPVYSHERVSRGGKSFKCYKFRSMYPDADIRLQDLLQNNPALKKEWETCRKLKNDPRVTPFGSFLRKTSLDELPQFWNVLKGDLSVVGPRPVMKDEVVQYYGHKAHKILSVRPGLTGIWQTSGRSNTSYENRIQMDEHYIDNQSFLLDVKLVAKTIPSMICSKDAF